MVLVAVDDLLFSSKIRATAKQSGVELTFVRTPAEILEAARSARPELVIFDLNSAKTDPLQTIATLKGDPELAPIPIVVFASHVHTALISGARAAGADEVYPRSAFVAHLAEILQSGRRGSAPAAPGTTGP